jgi:hypothetical protein
MASSCSRAVSLLGLLALTHRGGVVAHLYRLVRLDLYQNSPAFAKPPASLGMQTEAICMQT